MCGSATLAVPTPYSIQPSRAETGGKSNDAPSQEQSRLNFIQTTKPDTPLATIVSPAYSS